MPENHSTKAARAAIYFRMSKDDQENSIERQEGQVHPYAVRAKLEIVKTYKDEGIAGWKSGDDRPDFRRMLNDAQRGLFDVILCDDVDRFGRFDMHQYGAVVDRLRQVGVRLETVAQGPIDWDDAMSQISDAIRMVFKREQSSDTSRRILTRFIQMARDGKWINGKAPYGYAKDKATGRLELGDPAEVRTVKWLYETYATKDVSLRWMAAELFNRGVRNPRGTKNGKGEYRWTGQSLNKMLHNRNYLGDLHWNRGSRGEFQEFNGQQVVKRKAKGEKKRPEAQWIIAPKSHPAIIDRETFEAVQAKMDNRRGANTPHLGGGDFLLSGLMVCGHCGSRMVGRMGWGRKIKRPVYICNGYNRWGLSACNAHWIDQKALTDALVRKVQADFLNPENLERLRAELRRQSEEATGTNPSEARRIKTKIAALDQNIAKGNRNMALADPDAIAGIAQAVREWRVERDRFAGELEAAQRGPDLAGTEAEIISAEAHLWRLREVLERAEPAEVRAVLKELVSKIELWWEPRQAKGRVRCAFTKGLIHLQSDDAALLSGKPCQCNGTGVSASIPRASKADLACSAHNSPNNSAIPSPE